MFTDALFAEGTKEIVISPGGIGYLAINKGRNDFGFFNGDPDYRINISISSTSERFRFGFGSVFQYTDMIYRIKDPSGNIVYGPSSIPFSGAGFISTYDEAVTGPFPGGYPYLELTPQTTGNYYIEFFYPSDTGYSDQNQHCIEYFDFTVVNSAGQAIPGRVWSKAWQFWCNSWNALPPNSCDGSLMILSDDSIVTKINFNGIVPGTFLVSSNQTGCFNTGNYLTDRQSVTGSHTYPKYKVFFNDPDSALYPTAKLTTGIIPPVEVSTSCVTGVDFKVKVKKDGTLEVLIEVNPNPGQDPEDVKILANVKANPGPGGQNIIHWDGRDHYGQLVDAGRLLFAKFTSISGITHLPLYDIEFNEDGFLVSQVRPHGSQISLFWDDSLLPGGAGTVNTQNGCLSGTGCHTWDKDSGDTNTINSWWYIKDDSIAPVSFTLLRTPAPAGNISGPPNVCLMAGTASYTIHPVQDASEYIWSFTDSTVTIIPNDTTVILNFTSSSRSGILQVYAHNPLCGDGLASSMEIMIDTTMPSVELQVTPKFCRSDGLITFTQGIPPGGIYTVDSDTTDVLDATVSLPGSHLIIYYFSENDGCSAADSAWVIIDDCDEGLIPVFPNAFTPNDDGLNDFFKPFLPVHLIFADYHLTIFGRNGQILFESSDPKTGWDGKLNGSPCPCDIYVWEVAYQKAGYQKPKESNGGIVTLLR